MTVVAAEAIPAIESAAPAAASTAGRTAGSKAAGKAPAKAPPQPGVSTRRAPRARQQAQATEISYVTPEGKERTAQLPEASVPEHTWHRWIMAEFVLAVILVGASPFLKPGGPAAKAPSFAAPLVRLTAVSLIYFILALMAQGPRSGKIAAAFGGLVLLGTAFNSLPEFVTLGQAFAPGKGIKQPGSLAGDGGDTGDGGSGGRPEPQ